MDKNVPARHAIFHERYYCWKVPKETLVGVVEDVDYFIFEILAQKPL